MEGYAHAWLEPGSPLEADAVTLTPYLGADSLRETLSLALRHGKGAFVLTATSNPEAYAVRRARSWTTPWPWVTTSTSPPAWRTT